MVVGPYSAYRLPEGTVDGRKDSPQCVVLRDLEDLAVELGVGHRPLLVEIARDVQVPEAAPQLVDVVVRRLLGCDLDHVLLQYPAQLDGLPEPLRILPDRDAEVRLEG